MVENNPKISVIMPSLNVANYIGQCMDSVINQTLTDIEIICIDSGSDDGTLDILNKYLDNDSRITIIHSDKKSYGFQVNLGLNSASGEYISIIETDDFIKEDMFEQLLLLSEDFSVDIIKGSYFIYDESHNPPKIDIDNVKSDITRKDAFVINEEPLFLEGHPSIWAGLYKRSFLEEFDIKMIEEPGGGWVDNPFFYKTAILARSIKYVNKPFYYYRVSNPNSSSNNFSDFSLPMKRILDIFDILDDYSYDNKDVIILFYNRLFRYIEIILENNNNSYKNLDYNTCLYIVKVLQRVDKNIVNRCLKNNFKKLYYKFISPLFMMRFDVKNSEL